jgi:hypothetical protein
MQLPHRAVLPLRLRDPRLARPIALATSLASLGESQAQPAAAALRPKSDYSARTCGPLVIFWLKESCTDLRLRWCMAALIGSHRPDFLHVHVMG